MAQIDAEAGIQEKNKSVLTVVFVLRCLVHIIFFVHHNVILFHGIFFMLAALNSGVDKLWEGCVYSWAFITNWNMLFQSVFLLLALVYDIQEWRKSHHTPLAQKVKYYRDVIFCGLVFPFTLFVSAFFWVIYAIDRELVFPVIYDTVVPFWFNHCVHTNITVLVLLETLLQARRHPTNEKVETACVAAIGIAYAVVYYGIHFCTQRWLYKIFAIMTWWQICLFQLFIWSVNYITYRIQFPINRLFHKEDTEEKNAEDKNTEGPNNQDMVEKDFIHEKNNEEDEHRYTEKSLYLKCRSNKDQFEKTKF